MVFVIVILACWVWVIVGFALIARRAARVRKRFADPSASWASLTGGVIDSPRDGDLNRFWARGRLRSGSRKTGSPLILVAFDRAAFVAIFPGRREDVASIAKGDDPEFVVDHRRQGAGSPALVTPLGGRLVPQGTGTRDVTALLTQAGWRVIDT